MRIVFLLAALAGAAPATKPGDDSDPGKKYTSAISDYRKAEDAVRDATMDAEASFNKSAECVSLTAALATARAKLESARSSGTPEEKLNASAAFNRSRTKLRDAHTAFIKNDVGIRAANRDLAASDVRVKAAESEMSSIALAAEKDRQQKEEAAEAERMKDPIYAAAKEGKVVAGMTEAQLVASLHKCGYVMEPHTDQYLSDGKQVTVTTYLPGGPTISTNYKKIVVTNGIVTAIKTFSSSDFVADEANF